MSVKVKLTDGFLDLDHAPFDKSLAFVKSMDGRKWHRTGKYWEVAMMKSEFLSLATNAGIWDCSLVEDVKGDEVEEQEEQGEVTLKSWIVGLKLALQLRHGINYNKYDVDEGELAIGFDNGWSVNEAVDVLVEAGVFS